MLNAYGFIKNIFEIFEFFKTSIDMITTSEVAVSVTIDDAKHLDEIVAENKLTANAVLAIYPANSINEDVYIYEDEAREKTLATLHFLRNQQEKEKGVPNLSLADFTPLITGTAIQFSTKSAYTFNICFVSAIAS